MALPIPVMLDFAIVVGASLLAALLVAIVTIEAAVYLTRRRP
jgi:hypothetical protein